MDFVRLRGAKRDLDTYNSFHETRTTSPPLSDGVSTVRVYGDGGDIRVDLAHLVKERRGGLLGLALDGVFRAKAHQGLEALPLGLLSTAEGNKRSEEQ